MVGVQGSVGGEGGEKLQETGKQEARTGRTGFLCAQRIFVAIFSRRRDG